MQRELDLDKESEAKFTAWQTSDETSDEAETAGEEKEKHIVEETSETTENSTVVQLKSSVIMTYGE